MVSLSLLYSTGSVKQCSAFWCPSFSSPLQNFSKVCYALCFPHPYSRLKTFSNHHICPITLPLPLLTLGESQRPMAQGENVVANMAKYYNNRLLLRAVSMHAVRTGIEDN